MTEGLKQIDRIISDLDEVRRWEKFYKESHKIEPPEIPIGASGMFFTHEITTSFIKWRLESLKEVAFERVDELIKKQQTLINKLKKKK